MSDPKLKEMAWKWVDQWSVEFPEHMRVSLLTLLEQVRREGAAEAEAQLAEAQHATDRANAALEVWQREAGSAHAEVERLSAGQNCMLSDLSALLRALGLGDHARPETPHFVMLGAIAEATRLRERGAVLAPEAVAPERDILLRQENERLKAAAEAQLAEARAEVERLRECVAEAEKSHMDSIRKWNAEETRADEAEAALAAEQERSERLVTAGNLLREALRNIPASWGGVYEIGLWDAALAPEAVAPAQPLPTSQPEELGHPFWRGQSKHDRCRVLLGSDTTCGRPEAEHAPKPDAGREEK